MLGVLLLPFLTPPPDGAAALLGGPGPGALAENPRGLGQAEGPLASAYKGSSSSLSCLFPPPPPAVSLPGPQSFQAGQRCHPFLFPSKSATCLSPGTGA